MRYWLISLLALLVLSPKTIWAATQISSNGDVTAFAHITRVSNLGITEPKVVELTYPAGRFESDFLITEESTQTPQPLQVEAVQTRAAAFSVTSPNGNGSALTDNNGSTYVDFPLSAEGTAQTTLTYHFAKPSTISGITLNFATYSQAPDLIKIEGTSPDDVILDTTRYTSPTVRFPKQAVTNLTVTLTYSQPLRLTNVGIIEEQANPASGSAVRFLAKPNQNYIVYSDPDRNQTIETAPSGNLFLETDPIRPTTQTINNPLYKPADSDSDGVADTKDNCPNVTNADQKDSNNNNVGDVCEDTDFDYVINTTDNCPDDANPNQSDVDGDGIGDVCDTQESRFTEQYPWLPWAMMAGTAIIISVLALQMAKSAKLRNNEELTEEKPENSPEIK